LSYTVCPAWWGDCCIGGSCPYFDVLERKCNYDYSDMDEEHLPLVMAPRIEPKKGVGKE